ncbi:hypothetical protein QE408_001423 [Agrobacterium larrymoorei]|uniref:Type II toxin-antitoxin system VapC family toxin n=1 Tax=Agrobacterium larrymoorei TaxID=160699 RepID=A0ABU0UH75_9HYPH|nr:hypothetical protein [Agrobacterium larrymoorei]
MIVDTTTLVEIGEVTSDIIDMLLWVDGEGRSPDDR